MILSVACSPLLGTAVPGGWAMKRLAEMTGPEVRSLLNAVAKATRTLLPPGTAFVSWRIHHIVGATSRARDDAGTWKGVE